MFIYLIFFFFYKKHEHKNALIENNNKNKWQFPTFLYFLFWIAWDYFTMWTCSSKFYHKMTALFLRYFGDFFCHTWLLHHFCWWLLCASKNTRITSFFFWLFFFQNFSSRCSPFDCVSQQTGSYLKLVVCILLAVFFFQLPASYFFNFSLDDH